jgi:hypothetical protein
MATNAVAAEGAGGIVDSRRRHYAPGWLDAIIAWIERLPGPIWAAYVVFSVVALAVVAVEATLSSRGLFGQQPLYFAYAFFHVYLLAAYHFVSLRARSAWDAFRPATDFSDAEAENLRTQLSTTPARGAVVVYLTGVAVYLSLMASAPAGFDLVGHQPAFVALRAVTEAFWMAPLSWMLVYLLFRQMRIVSHLHRSVLTVDLLKPRPLHALARLTASASLLLLVVQLGIVFVPLPNLSESVRVTLSAIIVPFIVFALAAFLLPLQGMHALLEGEKARRLDAVSDGIEATVATIHQVVDEEKDARDAESVRVMQLRVDALSKAQASLLAEREFTTKLSTWPWDTSTFRTVLSAVALPIVLFLVTRVLERFVF